MKPSRRPLSGTDDLFRSRLENIIDMRHELVRLAGAIDWTFFDDAYEAFYSEEGHPGIRTCVNTVRSGPKNHPLLRSRLLPHCSPGPVPLRRTK